MKMFINSLKKAMGIFLIFTVICGVAYTGVVTGASQLLFADKANGSIIEVNGKKYGTQLLGQQYTQDKYMWGRIMNIDTATYKDENGNFLMYSYPANVSPASEKYKQLIAQRVEKLRKANPNMREQAIPVDLVTCSASGLDPHISPAAAQYQVARIALAQGKSEQDIKDIINQCTEDRFLGIFGEKTVNVLKVNLMLEGILS